MASTIDVGAEVAAIIAKELAMDTGRFDRLSRSLIAPPSRRSMLGLALGGALATLFGLADAEAKRKRKKKKKKKPSPPPPQVPPAPCGVGAIVGYASVPATGATVSTPVLAAGQRYRLRASGFWGASPTNGIDAFADFSFANPNVTLTTFNGVRLGLSVDGGNIDQWGSYNTDHVYERDVLGQGAALSLRCSDAIYEDNFGGLVLVEILCA